MGFGNPDKPVAVTGQWLVKQNPIVVIVVLVCLEGLAITTSSFQKLEVLR